MLGWDDAWATAAKEIDPSLVAVRISAEHRGAYHALGDGGTGWVELTGKAYNEARDKRALPTVGDWILVERWDTAIAGRGAAIIRHVLPRRSLLVRKAAGEATAPQPIAANVDLGIVLTSANADLSIPRLDRYLALLRDGGIRPLLVLSKVDLVPDPAPMLAQLQTLGDALGVSTHTGEGIVALRALALPGTTSVLLGSSGVGKSTLLNAVAEQAQRTRVIRADERGVHTTTHRELFAAPDGALWIDTPGMRELAQFLDEDSDDGFADITALAEGCKFRDCKHVNEPGCAVRDVVAPARLASFHKLAGERAAAVVSAAAARRIAETRRARGRKRPPGGD
jgi:ribosome biogenesis GTPase / thiamine phosphate phosphatase